jgi:alkylhydroperoxidase family enzyme
MLDFAEKVVLEADRISESDVADLRRVGFADEEIFDVAAAAAARCFYTKVLGATGTEPGDELADLQSALADAVRTSIR